MVIVMKCHDNAIYHGNYHDVQVIASKSLYL